MSALRALPFVALAALLIGGCATTQTLSVSPQNPTAPVFQQARPRLISAKRNTVAVWLLTPVYKKHLKDLLPPAFLVIVQNNGAQPVGLPPDAVVATADGQSVRLVSYQEYVAAIGHEADRLLRKVQSYHSAALAPSVQPEYWTTDTQDNLEYVPPQIVGNSAGYSQELQAQTEENSIAGRRDWLLNDARLMEPPTSVAPSQIIRRVVRLEPSDLSDHHHLRILVNLGEETHEFLYDVGT